MEDASKPAAKQRIVAQFALDNGPDAAEKVTP